MVKHDVILRGYGAAALDAQAPPLLVKRTETEFIPALLQALRQRVPAAQLGATSPEDLAPDGRRRLFLPVHRAFNLVVLEAVCDAPGHPRIHPRDIDSAGFVVRQVDNAAQPATDLAWQVRDEQAIGWRRPVEPQADPDLAKRRPRLRTGHRGINAEIVRRYAELEPPAERIAPLFLAPPEVCTDAGRTLLYGLVPVTSSEELTVDPATLVNADDVRTLLPEFLRPGTGDYRPMAAGGTLNLQVVTQSEDAGLPGALGLFLLGLKALHAAWRVFTPGDADAAALRALLNRIQLRWANDVTQPLGDHLESIVQSLLVQRRADVAFTTAQEWPHPDAALAAEIEAEATRLLLQRHAGQPTRVKRFDDPAARYRIHAFVRVHHSEQCPPKLHWAAPGEPYAIAPWWENGGLVHTIALPDLDAAGIAKLKPNVAFALPPALANLLNRTSPKKLLEGSGSAPDNPAIAWICSFNIPIITICAFIVLNIILSLLDLIFHWMFMVKICLPIPKRK